MTEKRWRRAAPNLYSLLTGLVGVAVLLFFFFRQQSPLDLTVLLSFTLLAVLVSYFRVPIGECGAEVGIEGAILLGTTLVGGPAMGGWAAFVTGLVRGFAPPFGGSRRWAEIASAALFHSGRNALAMTAAWWAYRGLGGTIQPYALGPDESLALVALCITYVFARAIWLLFALLARGESWEHTRSQILSPGCFLAELLPLPTAVLVALTFVELRWSSFLLLALLYVGASALMRQMLSRIAELEDEVLALHTARQIESLAQSAESAGDLVRGIYPVCEQIFPVQACEIGLLEGDQIHVVVAAEEGAPMPSLRIPLTPKWEWILSRTEPECFGSRAELRQLPFSLSPMGSKREAQSAVFCPLRAPTGSTTAPESLGGIVLLSTRGDAFGDREMRRIAAFAGFLAPALASRLATAGADKGGEGPPA